MSTRTQNVRAISTTWTEADKEAFLAGVKEQGLDNLEELAEDTRTKTEDDVAHFVVLLLEQLGKQYLQAFEAAHARLPTAKRKSLLGHLLERVMMGVFAKDMQRLLETAVAVAGGEGDEGAALFAGGNGRGRPKKEVVPASPAVVAEGGKKRGPGRPPRQQQPQQQQPTAKATTTTKKKKKKTKAEEQLQRQKWKETARLKEERQKAKAKERKQMEAEEQKQQAEEKEEEEEEEVGGGGDTERNDEEEAPPAKRAKTVKAENGLKESDAEEEEEEEKEVFEEAVYVDSAEDWAPIEA